MVSDEDLYNDALSSLESLFSRHLQSEESAVETAEITVEGRGQETVNDTEVWTVRITVEMASSLPADLYHTVSECVDYILQDADFAQNQYSTAFRARNPGQYDVYVGEDVARRL